MYCHDRRYSTLLTIFCAYNCTLTGADPGFIRRGANSKGEGANLLFSQIFLKTAWKWRNWTEMRVGRFPLVNASLGFIVQNIHCLSTSEKCSSFWYYLGMSGYENDMIGEIPNGPHDTTNTFPQQKCNTFTDSSLSGFTGSITMQSLVVMADSTILRY